MAAVSGDLTTLMAPFFDRHLVFPLYEFLSAEAIYDENELLDAKLDLLRTTNMVDYMVEVYELRYPDVDLIPEEMKRRRDDVIQKLAEMQKKTEPIVRILEEEEVVTQFTNFRGDPKQLLEFLMKNFDFHPDMLDELYTYAKFKYECGDYGAAAEYLDYYKLLVPTTHKNFLSALWGKLGSEILKQNFDVAREDLNRLRNHIDNLTFDTELEQLQHRAHLIHWALFIYHNHEKGQDDIIDLFLNNQSYLNTIQILCPHILRYLASAIVINKKRRQSLKELVKVIQLEGNSYKDPITEFVECLYINYDFSGAQEKLRQCDQVLRNDFFLIACRDDFIESARLLIFEMFCRIHECISISNLAEKLNMNESEAEVWIVNLIRNARLDAKIDHQQGHVVMGTKSDSVYEQVMESTKMLSFRAQSVAHQLEKVKPEKGWSARQ